MRREGSRNRYFVRRIPSDVRSKAVGLRLTVPLGDGGMQAVIITSKSQAVRLSLGTDDPVKVKARNVVVDAYLERVWHALRDDTQIKLTNEQAIALAGRLADIQPGAATGPHFHPTPRFVYVLEGAVVLELDGKSPQTFKDGQAFVEMPGERHNFRNASTTEPARALGFQYAGNDQPLQTNSP